MTKDGSSGFAVTRDKELISVFSKPGAGLGFEAVQKAIELGAAKLDCYDGKLPKFYSRSGFKEYNRLPWADQYTPKGWKFDEFGKPDVVFMKLGKE